MEDSERLATEQPLHIRLERFGRDDFTQLLNWITSEELLFRWAGTSFKYPLDESQLETYLQPSMTSEPARIIFKALDQGRNEAVGHIALSQLDYQHRSASLSRVLVGPQSLRGKGVGYNMARLALEFGFEKLRLHRISLEVVDFNLPAIACYTKLGFVKEGHHRDTCKVGDKYWSMYSMSILESEYKIKLQKA